MRISTRGRYALSAMVVLSDKPLSQPMMLKDIANEANVPEGYLQQLFIGLRSGKLVIGSKGSAPGYMLAKPAKDISVGEVLRLMESTFTTVECLDEGKCDRKNNCVARNIWGGLKAEIDAFVDTLSLSDLCIRYNEAKKESKASWNYSI